MTTPNGPPKAYLLIGHSPIFPAHHSLFLPFTPSSKTGKLINIRGNSFSGFQHEIVPSYNISDYSGKWSLVLLGEIKEGLPDLNSTENRGGNGGSDRLEELALQVPAPTKSLNDISDTDTSTGRKKRVVLKNCQTWMREYVEVLVKEGALGEEAVGRLEGAAKN